MKQMTAVDQAYSAMVTAWGVARVLQIAVSILSEKSLENHRSC
ncbi:hypothetical protein [Pantoea ananatis]|nr:hypothetical protein [Pantoea ananatis]